LFIEFPLYAAVVDVVGCYTVRKNKEKSTSFTFDIVFIIQSSKNFSSMRTIEALKNVKLILKNGISLK